MNHPTSKTLTALLRILEVAERDGYVQPDGQKTKLQHLAHVAEYLRHRPGWEEVRREVNYVVAPSKGDGLPDTPDTGLSGWMGHAVQRLAIIDKVAAESLLTVPNLKFGVERSVIRRLTADWPEKPGGSDDV